MRGDFLVVPMVEGLNGRLCRLNDDAAALLFEIGAGLGRQVQIPVLTGAIIKRPQPSSKMDFASAFEMM